MKSSIRCAFVLGIFLTSAAQAEPVIIVGSYMLIPNTPGQTIQIFVSGNVPVQGMNFTAVIGDGGSTFGGVDDVVPKITADIVTGTIFAAHGANAVNQNPNGDFGMGLAAWSITTLNGTVNTSGLLATLTIDTTGNCWPTFALSLADPNVGVTDFAGIDATITNGTLVGCPEPTSAVLGLFAAAGLGAVEMRRRRVRRAA